MAKVTKLKICSFYVFFYNGSTLQNFMLALPVVFFANSLLFIHLQMNKHNKAVITTHTRSLDLNVRSR